MKTSIRPIIENVLLGVLFTFFTLAAFNTWRSTGQIQMLLLAIQEALLIGLIITRRNTTDISRSWLDAVIALAGTAAPLLQRAGGWHHPLMMQVGIGVQIVGLVISIIAVASLGRSFGILAANRGVKTNGLYRLVRHPLYGSYLFSYLGFLLGNASLLNLLVIIFSIAFQYLRTKAEEQVLLRDPTYQTYIQKVRYRFIPFLI
ncbi:methyltransferase family protein [Candidatus Oscillochloris fontis]|uniref:methyltransferase family protein n=1 Tax=Candidatus Oscillochloris fontis TaxID=2496868 RepID=UPI00101C89BF|nr:isoprenylcysteine carboxylmethyltransferase family protein [Candidatus Oscillochloris fontis]